MISLVSLAFLATANSTDPSINYIDRDPANTKRVRIHFDTDAGRTYYLQYARDLASTNWSNLFTSYNLPITNHYIIYDTASNATRVYRLRVTTP